MNLIQCFLSQNECYKIKKSIVPKGIMVHSTGANNPNIKRYVQPADDDPNRDSLLNILGVNQNHNDWNHIARDACVHAFIGRIADDSIAVCQTLPWNHRGWHAGTGTTGKSANDTHISFEICEDDLTDKVYFEQTKNAAVELVATLCIEYDLDPFEDGVIICHKDGYDRGIACGHQDIYNWWPKYNYTMDDFRSEVGRKIKEMKGDDDMVYYKTKDEIPSWYAPAIRLVEEGWIKGDGTGDLHLSEDMCRIITLLDNMGKL